MTEPNDPFDFSAFVANATDADPETRKAILRDAVSDEMTSAMAEVAPRLWCVLQEQMMRDPKNNIHLNAVMNAGIFAILGWIVACTPEGEQNGTDNDQVMRDKIMGNLENALSNARGQGGQMSMIAHNAGKLKLMEDALAGISKTLVANSMIIKGVHEHLKGKPGA